VLYAFLINPFSVFWLENLKGGNYSEDQGVDGMINIRMDLREVGGVRIGCI